MSGWIKLYRDVRKHWIFQDDAYFRAWCIILMTVNHDTKKSLIGKTIIECERGQALLSLQSWVKEFGVKKWSIQRVRTFFQLLQDDNMISVEGLPKTTRLTVLNYESYQDSQHAANTQLTRSQHAANTQLTTTKECKEDKELKETKKRGKQSASQTAPKNDFLDQVIEQFCKSHGTYEIINKGKERLAAGRITGLYKKKYPDADSKETLEGLRAYFDKCNTISDGWLRENMSLSMILSKYNEINKILVNGKSTNSKKKSGGVSDEFRKWVLEGVLPTENVGQMS